MIDNLTDTIFVHQHPNLVCGQSFKEIRDVRFPPSPDVYRQSLSVMVGCSTRILEAKTTFTHVTVKMFHPWFDFNFRFLQTSTLTLNEETRHSSVPSLSAGTFPRAKVRTVVDTNRHPEHLCPVLQVIRRFSNLNPSTPNSDQFQISPAASPEI